MFLLDFSFVIVMFPCLSERYGEFIFLLMPVSLRSGGRGYDLALRCVSFTNRIFLQSCSAKQAVIVTARSPLLPATRPPISNSSRQQCTTNQKVPELCSSGH